jgi:hypothetical protein
VILLDTNQLLGKSPDAPSLRMLKKVAEQTGHDLVLPEMVAEEYLAHYRRDVEESTQRVKDGIDKLHRLVPRWPGETSFLRSVAEGAELARRAQLEDLFHIHPAPAEAWREAMMREASRRPPAKTAWEQGKPGSGARDAAVWLTVLDACASSRQVAYFVTGNSSDFGKDSVLRAELAQEARARLGQDADLLRYCSDIPDLMGQLGTASAQPPGEEEIGAAGQVAAAVEAALADDDVPFEFMSAIPSVALKVVGDFHGVRDLRLERLQGKAEAYQLGKDTWACARGVWHGRTSLWVCWKPELGVPVAGRSVTLSFTVSATIVMQVDGSGAITAAEVTGRGRIASIEE